MPGGSAGPPGESTGMSGLLDAVTVPVPRASTSATTQPRMRITLPESCAHRRGRSFPRVDRSRSCGKSPPRCGCHLLWRTLVPATRPTTSSTSRTRVSIASPPDSVFGVRLPDRSRCFVPTIPRGPVPRRAARVGCPRTATDTKGFPPLVVESWCGATVRRSRGVVRGPGLTEGVRAAAPRVPG